MHPVLFSIGVFSVYSYGLMVALGFAAAAYLAYKHAARLGIRKEPVVDMLVFSLIGGILGARLLYICLNMGYFAANPLEVFDLAKGGLVWYGGFAGGLITGVAYAKIKKMDLLLTLDLLMPYLALAQALGRIGCFMNGCCYGGPVGGNFPLGVTFPDSACLRHPAQLYSSALLLLIYFILRVWQELPHFKGEILLGYCLLYPVKRFLVEMIRGDNPKILLGLTISQLISAAVFVVALAIFIKMRVTWKEYLRSK